MVTKIGLLVLISNVLFQTVESTAQTCDNFYAPGYWVNEVYKENGAYNVKRNTDTDGTIPDFCLSDYDGGLDQYGNPPYICATPPDTVTEKVVSGSDLYFDWFLSQIYAQNQASDESWSMTESWQDLYSTDILAFQQQIVNGAGATEDYTICLSQTSARFSEIKISGGHEHGGCFEVQLQNYTSPNHTEQVVGNSIDMSYIYTLTPVGYIAGVRSYDHGIGIQILEYQYNLCSCASTYYELSDYSLKHLNVSYNNQSAQYFAVTDVVTQMKEWWGQDCGTANFVIATAQRAEDGQALDIADQMEWNSSHAIFTNDQPNSVGNFKLEIAVESNGFTSGGLHPTWFLPTMYFNFDLTMDPCQIGLYQGDWPEYATNPASYTPGQGTKNLGIMPSLQPQENNEGFFCHYTLDYTITGYQGTVTFTTDDVDGSLSVSATTGQYDVCLIQTIRVSAVANLDPWYQTYYESYFPDMPYNYFDFEIDFGECPVDANTETYNPNFPPHFVFKESDLTDQEDSGSASIYSQKATFGSSTVESLTEEQIQRYRDAFSLFDLDKNDNITSKEIGIVMRSLDYNPHKVELQEYIDWMEADGVYPIDFAQYLSIMVKNDEENQYYDLDNQWTNTEEEWTTPKVYQIGRFYNQTLPEIVDPDGFGAWIQKVLFGRAAKFASYNNVTKTIEIHGNKTDYRDVGSYNVSIFLEDAQGAIGFAWYAFNISGKEEEFDPDFEIIQTIEHKKGDIVPKIKKINPIGQVNLEFYVALGNGKMTKIKPPRNLQEQRSSRQLNLSQELDLTNCSNLPKEKVRFNEEIHPALEIDLIETFPGEYPLNFTWECINLTEYTMEIQMHFETPRNVSKVIPLDKLKMTFWGQPYFYEHTNHSIDIGLTAESELPNQMEIGRGKQVLAIGKNVSTGLLVGMSIMTILNFFMSFGLSNMVGSIKKLQIIIHMILVSVSIPANALLFYQYFLEVVCFDIIPTDPIYEWLFYFEDSEPISMNYGLLGYETELIIKNLGSIFIFMQYFPIAMFLCYYINYMNCYGSLKKKLQNIKKSLYYNDIIAFLNDGYIVFVITGTVNIMYSMAYIEDFHYGTFLSLVYGWFFVIICIPFPFIAYCILRRNLTKIKQRRPETKSYQALYEEIWIPREGSYLNAFGTGKEGIKFQFFAQLRVLILGLCLVILLYSPTFAIFSINFSTLLIIIANEIAGGHKDRGDNKEETINEFMVLSLNYHLFCFTNYVDETHTRHYIGYAFCLYTAIFILYNIYHMIYLKWSKEGPILRLRYLKYQNHKKVKKIMYQKYLAHKDETQEYIRQKNPKNIGQSMSVNEVFFYQKKNNNDPFNLDNPSIEDEPRGFIQAKTKSGVFNKFNSFSEKLGFKSKSQDLRLFNKQSTEKTRFTENDNNIYNQPRQFTLDQLALSEEDQDLGVAVNNHHVRKQANQMLSKKGVFTDQPMNHSVHNELEFDAFSAILEKRTRQLEEIQERKTALLHEQLNCNGIELAVSVDQQTNLKLKQQDISGAESGISSYLQNSEQPQSLYGQQNQSQYGQQHLSQYGQQPQQQYRQQHQPQYGQQQTSLYGQQPQMQYGLNQVQAQERPEHESHLVLEDFDFEKSHELVDQNEIKVQQPQQLVQPHWYGVNQSQSVQNSQQPNWYDVNNSQLVSTNQQPNHNYFIQKQQVYEPQQPHWYAIPRDQ